MAVFTPVSPEDARQFLTGFAAGDLVSLEPIAEGVENTNYRLETTAGVFALTLFEKRVRAEDLPFYLGLMEHLAGAGYPTPPPLRTREGALFAELNGRSAALVEWRPGAWPRKPEPALARRAGRLLARLHLDGQSFAPQRPNGMGPPAWPAIAARCAERATGEDAQLLDILQREIADLRGIWPKRLPQGAIHADYFPDNVLYVDGEVSAVIDFYFACTDALAYDVAIALGAWGFDGEGVPREPLMSALLAGYEEVRPLTPAEIEALPALCRGAALRFSLSRLHDRLFHDDSWLVAPKDPAPYVRRLQYYQARRSLVA